MNNWGFAVLVLMIVAFFRVTIHLWIEKRKQNNTEAWDKKIDEAKDTDELMDLYLETTSKEIKERIKRKLKRIG